MEPGATWEGREEKAPYRVATIWFSRKVGKDELWFCSWEYPDGSTEDHHIDSGPSFQACKRRLPFNCRMRRVQ